MIKNENENQSSDEKLLQSLGFVVTQRKNGKRIRNISFSLHWDTEHFPFQLSNWPWLAIIWYFVYLVDVNQRWINRKVIERCTMLKFFPPKLKPIINHISEENLNELQYNECIKCIEFFQNSEFFDKSKI